jgi:phosphoribosylaminoimidazolecarboxamide formyltransferase/IMP cyclohydrolase
VVVDPDDYAPVLQALGRDGGVSDADRRTLAGKAFARTAAYDAAIAGWFARAQAGPAAQWFAISGTRAGELRYGENPHQAAGFYRTGEARPGVATARQIQGKALSYNNIADADAAYEAVAEFDPAAGAAAVIVKHANPCGVAVANTPAEAYRRALATDPVSAFGGIVALNRALDAATAAEITGIFTEVLIVPEATDEALALLAGKTGLRILVAGAVPDPRGTMLTVRSVAGGLLVQQRDAAAVTSETLKVVTKRAPTNAERADLIFAMRVAKHVKSNAIVFARDGAAVGIGAGQMSRVDSARLAADKADDAARAAGRPLPATLGAVAASDAFFPFADGVEVLARAGATAVIQPGGSVRDGEVIAAADAAGMAMVLTGIRRFRH